MKRDPFAFSFSLKPILLDAGFHGAVVLLLFIAGFLIVKKLFPEFGPDISLICSLAMVLLYILLIMTVQALSQKPANMTTLQVPDDLDLELERVSEHGGDSLKDDGYEPVGTYCFYQEENHRLRIHPIGFTGISRIELLQMLEAIFHRVCGGGVAFYSEEMQGGAYCIPVPNQVLAQRMATLLEAGEENESVCIPSDRDADTWMLTVALSVFAIMALILSILLQGYLN